MTEREKNYLYARAFAAFFESLETWKEQSRLIGLPGDFDPEEYEVLLKYTDADVFVPLWASSGKGEDRPLLDTTTLEVIRFYKDYGFDAPVMDGNPRDYLGDQYTFLAYLYGCGEEEAAELFASLYTADTLKVFGAAVRRAGKKREGLPHDMLPLLERMEAVLLGEAPEPPATPETEEALAQMQTLRRLPAIPKEEPYIVPTAGINNCGGKCKINMTVCEGCITELSTDDTDNDPQIRACVRGRGYRYTFLNAGRLRYPMKRVGKRGEGRFRRISWEEAAREIARETVRIREQYGPEARFPMYGSGNTAVLRAGNMMKRLLNLDGGFLNYYNSYSSACVTFTCPFIYGVKEGDHAESDVLNSKLIILWGHNPAETIFGSYRNRCLAEARRKGIPIIVIDPRESDTAVGLADEWIPIRPATDAAMCDAMAYVMVEKGLHDLEFLHRFCVGFDEETMPEGAPAGESYLSYLTGVKDGVKKTPQWAEKICGVPAETIERLAVLYATTKPAALMPGYGPQRNGNGEQATRCFALLAAMTGNVGRAGGSSGIPGQPILRARIAFPQGKAPVKTSIPVFLWTKAIEHGTEMERVKDGIKGADGLKSNLKILYNLAGNTLINQHSDIHDTIRILQDESLCEEIVVSDFLMTPSCRFADLLLPAAGLFECDNFVFPWGPGDYVLSNQKAIEPLFGSMHDYDMVAMVADEMGLREAFDDGHHSKEEWLDFLYEEYRKKEPELPDFETFRKRGGWQFRNGEHPIPYRENIEEGVPFKTPSGKIEIFSGALYEMHDPMIPPIPRYMPAYEGPDSAVREKYPLQVFGYHTKRRCHSMHDRNAILEEVDPPALWIHPLDAQARGIGDGDMVEIFNDRGMIRIPAKVTDRIMQGVVSMSQGGWYRPDEKGVDLRGSINVLTHTVPTPLAKGNPQHTNLAEVRKAE